MVKASFIRRFAALVADGFIISVIGGLMGVIIGFLGYFIASIKSDTDQGFFSLLSFVFYLAAGWFYYIEIPLMNNGQTLGKKLFHIRIVKETGELNRPTLFVREYIGKFISGLILCIGYLLALGDSRKALHDRFVDTIVVKVPEKVYVDDRISM